MKCLALTEKGIEDISSKEIFELVNSKTQIIDNFLIFEAEDFNKLFLLSYKSQSLCRIILLLENFNYNNNLFEISSSILEKTDFSEWLNKKTAFRIRCLFNDNANVSASEIEKRFGEFVINNVLKNKKFKPKVNLGNPDITFLVLIKNNICYFGIDFVGFDLNKRTYKIFLHPESLKGTIAYALVRLSNFSKGKKMIDPFTGSGIIPIEAALFASNFPVNFYNKDKFSFLKFIKFKNFDFNGFFNKIDSKISKDKLDITGFDSNMKYVNFSKKNAKIAGIDKIIHFSKVDTEWLDIKFDKNSVDMVVTQIPSKSKFSSKKIIEKSYDDLFYNSSFILKNDGFIVLISKNLDDLKKFYEKHNFKVIETRKIYSCLQELHMLRLTKSTNL